MLGESVNTVNSEKTLNVESTLNSERAVRALEKIANTLQANSAASPDDIIIRRRYDDRAGAWTYGVYSHSGECFGSGMVTEFEQMFAGIFELLVTHM